MLSAFILASNSFGTQFSRIGRIDRRIGMPPCAVGFVEPNCADPRRSSLSVRDKAEVVTMLTVDRDTPLGVYRCAY